MSCLTDGPVAKSETVGGAAEGASAAVFAVTAYIVTICYGQCDSDKSPLVQDLKPTNLQKHIPVESQQKVYFPMFCSQLQLMDR